MHIEDPRLSQRLRDRLRRPSTLALLGAGLLAADLLRRPEAWTDATFGGFVLALGLALWVLWRRRAPARSRETHFVLLPATTKPLCDPRLSRPAPPPDLLRNRVLLFLLVVLTLVVLPALLVHGAGL